MKNTAQLIRATLKEKLIRPIVKGDTTGPSNPNEWTTDRPTKPGRYWCQMPDIRPHVVELVLEPDSHRLTIAQSGTYVNDLEPENYRWAGPVEPPA